MAIHNTASIQGQLNERERQILVDYLLMERPPRVAVEIGTWLGGGSTLHILREFARLRSGHLWGVEADASIYERMTENIRNAIPEALPFFTPLFGFSQLVLPKWITEMGPNLTIDFAFLDGSDSPMEQIDEFHILDPYIPVGGRILSHDAKLRKGKFFVPYLKALEHYEVVVHNVSEEGILSAVKLRSKATPERVRDASALLKRLRSQPIELFGKLAPRWTLRLAARVLPRQLVRQYAEGRKA